MSELGQRRRHARQRALELAYEAAAKNRSLNSIVAEQALAPDPYTVKILESTETHRALIESTIEQFSIEWTLERLALIDRLVMTLALGEWMMDGRPPTAVILDEAVELAKIFSTDGSGPFVNGVLSACIEHLE